MAQNPQAQPEDVTPLDTADMLSDQDLDAVSGGINPQPLPPIRRIAS